MASLRFLQKQILTKATEIIMPRFYAGGSCSLVVIELDAEEHWEVLGGIGALRYKAEESGRATASLGIGLQS